MISPKHRRAKALSVGAYDALMHAYPASFRAEYANEMRWAFSRLCADALALRGLTGLLGVWRDTLAAAAVRRPDPLACAAVVGDALDAHRAARRCAAQGDGHR